MSLFPYSSPSIIGLDIGEQSLKVAVIRARTTWKGTRKLDLLMLQEFPVPKDAIIRGELRDTITLSELLRSVHTQCENQGVKTTEVVLGISESQSYLLAHPAQEGADDAVAMMAREIPYTVDELYYDHQVVAEHRILGAAPRHYVDTLITVAETAGFTVAAVDLEGLATVRAVAHAHPKETANTWGLIDFGATRTQWILAYRDIITSTVRLPVAGASLTKAIVDTLHLSEEQAERTKRECGIDPARCKGSLQELLLPHFETLAKRMSETTVNCSHIALVGGGALMPGVGPYLESALHIPMFIPSLLDPFHYVDQKKIPEHVLGFATAIGLALRHVAL